MHLMALVNAGMRGLIVRKTLASLGSTALVTFREHVLKEALAAGDVVFYGGSPQESPQYRYRNGSVIVVGGMDRPSRIMSSEYDVVYVQEATELAENDWESICTRLRYGRVSFQQLIADCNPDTPTHWLKVRADAGRTVMLESRHEENPRLYADDGALTEGGAAYISKLDNLTGVRYQRLRRGQWVAAEGLIYEDWDSAVHLIDRFDIPDEWTRWWAVDFGYTNPFVCQMWAEDPDGRLYLYREIYHTKRTVDQHSKDILAAMGDEPRPRGIICDHDAEGRAVLAREVNVGTKAANKKVSVGIQVVQRRLRLAGDGKPRLFIMRDSVWRRDSELVEARRPTCTAEEVVGYVWDQGAGKAPKEVPLKDNDHGMDAMRYLCAARDISPPRVRFI
jgi:phage terminase large subunit